MPVFSIKCFLAWSSVILNFAERRRLSEAGRLAMVPGRSRESLGEVPPQTLAIGIRPT